jgi:UDP-N-acetylmuramyl pentapeptide phosphotransferase/UDP-N-acetylglucosamine-1-phosphate transferase
LWFNWPPARIFMGDVGSVFLGFLFAMLALMAGWRHPWTGVAGALLVWPFVFDASVTFLRRAARGENVLRAHRSHLYQRLVGAGWTHRRTTLFYGALAAVGVIAGGLCQPGTGFGRMLAAIVATGGAAVLWVVATTVESRAPAGVPVTSATNTPTSA